MAVEPGAERGGEPEGLGDELLALALDIATEAVALVSASAARRRELQMTRKSSATDLVTEADHAVEALIRRRLTEARPHDAVMGEEGDDVDGTSGVRWVIDPIDGTTNFVYGVPCYAVSIGAEWRGVATAGVVAVPGLSETFAARRGAGAACNGEPIRASGATELATALVGTGFSYDATRRGEQGLIVSRLLPEVRDIRRMGAASFDLCSVACGRLDAYYESGLAPWDHAAGALIATEAGAMVTDLAGGSPSRTALVAAPAGLHEAFLRLLLRCGA